MKKKSNLPLLGKSKATLVYILVGLSAILLLVWLGVQSGFTTFHPSNKPSMSHKQPEEVASSGEVKIELESKHDTPFSWTYEDYQGLEIGVTTLAEVKDRFGPGNQVYKKGEAERSFVYSESRPYSDEEPPLQMVSLRFERQGDDFYLRRKEATNMAIPYQPVSKDQQVFNWTKEMFDAVPIPTYDNPSPGLTYEEAVATYGQPHQLLTFEAMSAEGSSKLLYALYTLEDDNYNVTRVFLDFVLEEDGKYHLEDKSSDAFED